MHIETVLRKGSLGDLVEMLKRQNDVKFDVVVPASALRYEAGRLVLAGGSVRVDDEGVSTVDAVFDPTPVFEDGVSTRLEIPRAYLRRLRESGQQVVLNVADGSYAGPASVSVALLDANVNGWLQSLGHKPLLLRAFKTDDADDVGIARSLLSDRFAPYDDYDVILAGLAGVREAGVDTSTLQIMADRSERNMRVKIVAPEITAMAPVLLANYRSPWQEMARTIEARNPNAGPVVQGGFQIRNSETGGGAFQVVPWLRIPICGNGMTVTQDALRAVHLGGKLDEGIVRWSDDTRRTALELITAKARDAVKTFLDVDYVRTVIERIEQVSATPVTDPVLTIQRVAKVHAFSDDEQKSILDLFIKSGDVTAGGVMNAVTAAAQTVEDPDRAAEIEDSALDVLVTASRS